MPTTALDHVEVIKLLLVDDEPAVRRGLRMRLEAEPDVIVVGEAVDGDAALTLAQTLQPDVVLMDVEMPHTDGIEAATALRAICPGAAVIVLTIHDDAATRARAEAAGVAAFVTKRGGMDTLLGSIRQASSKTMPNKGHDAATQ